MLKQNDNPNSGDKIERIAFRVAELVKRGPVKKTKIYDAIRAGELPARTLGAVTFVLGTDWQSYLESQPLKAAARDRAA